MNQNLTILIALTILWLGFFSSSAVREITGEIVRKCSDSDDINFFTRGEVIVEDQKLSDVCDREILTEFYCEAGFLKFRNYRCPFGCKDGVCVESLPLERDETGFVEEEKSYKIGSRQNALEINENLGDVTPVLSKDDFKALAGGVVSTSSGSTRYDQYLRFKDNDFNSGKIIFAEDERNEVGDFLYFEKNKDIFEYAIDFGDGFSSSIKSNELVDLEDEKLNLFGKRYYVSDTKLDGNKVRLRLMGGDFFDEIEEGERRIYSVDGRGIEISVNGIDDENERVNLGINGKNFLLEKGEYEAYNSEIFGISNVFVNEALESSDFIEFFIGAEIIDIEDNYNDDKFSQGVKINGDSVSDSYVKIKAVKIGNELKISSIKYRVRANPDIYIEEKGRLSEYIRNKESLIGGFDIIYNGARSDRGITNINFDPSGNKYRLSFVNNKDQDYNLDFVVNNNGNLELGNENEDFHFIEGTSNTNFIVKKNDFFVLSSENDANGVSNVLRYRGIDTNNKILSFDDLDSGLKEIVYSGSEGDGSGNLVVSGNSYSVYVGSSPDYNLAIDLDGDGIVNGREVNIVVKGGGLIDLGSSINPNNDFDVTLKTLAKRFVDVGSDEIITINVKKSGSNIDVDIPSQSSLTIESENGKKTGLSNYGVYYVQDVNDGADELLIRYPSSQLVGDVEVVFSGERASGIYEAESEVLEEQEINEREIYADSQQEIEYIEEEQPGEVESEVYKGKIEEPRLGFWKELLNLILEIFK